MKVQEDVYVIIGYFQINAVTYREQVFVVYEGRVVEVQSGTRHSAAGIHNFDRVAVVDERIAVDPCCQNDVREADEREHRGRALGQGGAKPAVERRP